MDISGPAKDNKETVLSLRYNISSLPIPNMAETFQYGTLKNEVVTIPPGRGQPPYQHGGQPASSAVGQIQWMAPPPSIPGCPPGLEYLTQLDQILVHQQVELLEVFTGIETQNRYQIKNALGQQVFFAYEESELCMRLCCGPGRGFMMHVVNNMNQEVLRMVRPFQCCSGCCWCAGSCDHCSRTIAIESPPGQPIGHVRQRGSSWKAHYEILDANMDPVLKIRGPCWFCQGICCTCDIDFKVLSLDEVQEVGNITKQWGGFAKECFTKADNFGIQFPVDLDVKMKATLLGALILIEFMYYEQKKKNNR